MHSATQIYDSSDCVAIVFIVMNHRENVIIADINYTNIDRRIVLIGLTDLLCVEGIHFVLNMLFSIGLCTLIIQIILPQ